MPLYEFECQSCHHRFEKIQGISVADPACPKCGGTVERLLHAPAVQFKGSGWYVTDYAKSGASGAKSDARTGDKAEASTTKTESKTESKPESKKPESKTSGASKD